MVMDTWTRQMGLPVLQVTPSRQDKVRGDGEGDEDLRGKGLRGIVNRVT